MWKCVGRPGAPSAYDERGADEAPHGALVGRKREVADLRALLAEHRLVTVTGGAGVGKSRLADAAVRNAADMPWRRVVRVRAQSSGPGAPGTLAAAVRQAFTGMVPLPKTAGRARLDELRELVAAQPGTDVLLLLDDVDPFHLECLGVVQSLLMAVPKLRVLVTSRRSLGLGDEHAYRLAPLSTRPPGTGGGHAPAVELFLARARSAVDGFCPDAAALRTVAAVCRSLEGFPLAVELAARQLARYGLDDLADLLERHQCWLDDPRPHLGRHRSLRDALGAGYVLCGPSVRTVWSRASVFVGAFNESAAVLLCAGGTVEPHEVLGCIAQLTRIGVLEALRDPGGLREPRYRMTRAARDFGTERLRDAGEYEVALQRRMVHCWQIAAVAENLWGTGSQAQAVQLFREEEDDIRAMLRYALGHPEHAAVALDTVVNLWFWWAVHDAAEEGRGYLLHLLPMCPAESPQVMRGRWLMAWLSAGNDPRAARALLGRAWPAAVIAGDDATIGRIALVLGTIALYEGDPRTAAEHFAEAVDTIPELAPGGPSQAVGLAALAVAQAFFAPAAARRAAHRALTGPGLRNDAWACVIARYAKALVDHLEGRGGRARSRARRTLAALDDSVPAPHSSAALRRLIADIEAGVQGSPRAFPVPLPRTVVVLPVHAGVSGAP
ncbi:ATP-binding protein [Streptomyces sp. NPDC050504]|uniref:ATP-binding protein n=1 Tax=Streptomyces sp. NPDC050504 TaxID=3365618 RepID=UPI0037B78C5C